MWPPGLVLTPGLTAAGSWLDQHPARHSIARVSRVSSEALYLELQQEQRHSTCLIAWTSLTMPPVKQGCYYIARVHGCCAGNLWQAAAPRMRRPAVSQASRRPLACRA